MKGSPVADRVDVPRERQYIGFDAYKNVIDQVDVVLLTTTPHFRPIHMAYAVEKGVHMFVEKPVATDAPGVRSVIQTCEDAKKKNLSVVSGLCWRYYEPRREAMSASTAAISARSSRSRPRTTPAGSGSQWSPAKSEVGHGVPDAQLVLLHLAERRPHRRAGGPRHRHHGLGARATSPDQVLGLGWPASGTEPKYGNIFDHFSIVYEYPNNVRGYHTCRHWRGSAQQVKDYVLGASGTCDVFGETSGPRITGEKPWRYRGPSPTCTSPSTTRCSPRSCAGKPINNGLYAARARSWRSWAG